MNEAVGTLVFAFCEGLGDLRSDRSQDVVGESPDIINHLSGDAACCIDRHSKKHVDQHGDTLSSRRQGAVVIHIPSGKDHHPLENAFVEPHGQMTFFEMAYTEEPVIQCNAYADASGEDAVEHQLVEIAYDQQIDRAKPEEYICRFHIRVDVEPLM